MNQKFLRKWSFINLLVLISAEAIAPVFYAGPLFLQKGKVASDISLHFAVIFAFVSLVFGWIFLIKAIRQAERKTIWIAVITILIGTLTLIWSALGLLWICYTRFH